MFEFTVRFNADVADLHCNLCEKEFTFPVPVPWMNSRFDDAHRVIAAHFAGTDNVSGTSVERCAASWPEEAEYNIWFDDQWLYPGRVFLKGGSLSFQQGGRKHFSDRLRHHPDDTIKELGMDLVDAIPHITSEYEQNEAFLMVKGGALKKNKAKFVSRDDVRKFDRFLSSSNDHARISRARDAVAVILPLLKD